MRSIYLLTLLLLFSCEQQDSKSIVKKEIKYQLDSLEMNGYLVYDESIKEKRPAILASTPASLSTHTTIMCLSIFPVLPGTL